MYSFASLIDFFNKNKAADNVVSSLSLSQVTLFIQLAIHVRGDILLVQSHTQDPSTAPHHLSPTIVDFLSAACAIGPDVVSELWRMMGPVIWDADDDVYLLPLRNAVKMEEIFRMHGGPLGISSARSLYPAIKKCTTVGCSGAHFKLHTVSQYHAVLLTIELGPLPVWAINFTCNACKVTYHLNYHVENGQRTYSNKIPDILQITEHYFAERRLVEQWRIMMNVSWTSGSNCIAIYLQQFPNTTLPTFWSVQLSITHRLVFDAFILYCLWRYYEECSKAFVVPNTGENRERFREAIRERNMRMKLLGQPEKRHRCDKCVRVHLSSDSLQPSTTTFVVVMDGTVFGHYRCGVAHCLESLATTKDDFCPLHVHLATVCRVFNCASQVVPKTKACSDPAHAAAALAAKPDHGTSFFLLKRRLLKSQARSVDSGQPIPLPVALDEDEDGIMSEEEKEENEDSGEAKMKKHKGQFGRKRTHNEQILVCPGGVILARETFFNAESLPACVEFVEQTFWDSKKPDHAVFDNNCSLAQHVKDRTWWRSIGLTVDPFHLKTKHKESDNYCQQHCNPIAYPELYDSKTEKWWFNTSIAEQTNVWLGKFFTICREMVGDVYNFYLDEMVMMRNEATVARLQREGYNPTYWTSDDML